MARPFKGQFNRKVKVTRVCPAGEGHSRLQYDHNVTEKLFRLAWQNLHQGPMYGGSTSCDLISRLLQPYETLERGWLSMHSITQRDRAVAATVIQWLGTNFGHCFLREVLKEDARVRGARALFELATEAWPLKQPRLVDRRHTPKRRIEVRVKT
jgi:hypothetical protein